MEYLHELDHRKSMRSRQSLKEDKIHVKVNYNPSSVSPGEELIIKMPKLTSDTIIFSDSLVLLFNYEIGTGAAASNIPDHLASAIIERYQMKINGSDVFDISNFNHYNIYKELWRTKQNYEKNLAHIGIQSTTTKSERHGIITGTDTLAAVHGKRYEFWLGSFLTDAALNPQAIL